ncbi:4-(cytidine 5'-diphospho)-2-C-methyl-D-erythritol kinase [Blastochloris sulfoviridis]|uniref:4-diphosphocytidyl-2-C-methyl-D-erythritol kinase n=1 Tax=Blastochloris sulfoviridis TaxID=50712 RepID=A0A5M6HW42_9HYPH|nr:4-(cytidine 5'-diphospho)-2-C-methyl-D-erythritol kinase [Blastochloris sulfoviridis]KAA5599897.1 4-(cytidine 5'-diphospho)-2-C-methyl-D-erythritol kinase [Blastochloris sulfoviridis]
MPYIDRASAKINLTLHVVGRRSDGWHLLESLVVFAGLGDTLTLDPGGPLLLDVAGPTAANAGPQDDNLVLKAARALATEVPDLAVGRFVLTKRLPVAAGLGGGSADAAAALRLLARANTLPLDDPRLHAAACATGADVPVCLPCCARIMRGTGHDLGPPLALPPLPAVLVNPGVPVATVGVFRALAIPPGTDIPSDHPAEDRIPTSREALIAALADLRNDLEPPARALAPAVGTAIEAVAATAGVRLVRMSGSGATVFGLYGTPRDASRAAAKLRAAHPGWWARATLLR